MAGTICILNGPNLNLLGTRESFRHVSYLSPVVDSIIAGFGVRGYELSVEAMAEKLAGGN